MLVCKLQCWFGSSKMFWYFWRNASVWGHAKPFSGRLNSIVAPILECRDIVSFFKTAGYARAPDHRESSSVLWGNIGRCGHYLEAMTAREMAAISLKCFADDEDISYVRTESVSQPDNLWHFCYCFLYRCEASRKNISSTLWPSSSRVLRTCSTWSWVLMVWTQPCMSLYFTKSQAQTQLAWLSFRLHKLHEESCGGYL